MNSEEVEDYFEAEEILGCRTNPKTKEKEYLVKWVGYSHDDNTWEPISHLSSAQDLLNAYHKAQGVDQPSKLGKKKSETSKKQAKRPPPKTPTSNKGNGGKQGQQPVDPSIPAFQDPLEHLSIPPSENNAGNPSSTRALRSRQKSNEVRNEIDCGENFQIVMLGMKNDVIVFLLETENDKFWVTRQAIFPTYAHKLCLFYEGHLKIRNS